jgi:hypothetical protein
MSRIWELQGRDDLGEKSQRTEGGRMARRRKKRRGLPAPPLGCACGWASSRAVAARAEQHEPKVCSPTSFAEEDGDNAELWARDTDDWERRTCAAAAASASSARW